MTATTTSLNNADLQALGLARDLSADKPKSKELGSKDFLTLMISQIKNQDPLKPTDGTEFLAQLAQFSTVAGLEELKTQFADLSSSLVSNQALQASGLLGRDVLVARSTGYLGKDGSLDAAVELAKPAAQVRIQVHNAVGEVVRNLALGPSASGLSRLSWDGIMSDGNRAPPGRYTLTAQALDAAGKQSSAPTLVAASVESVTLGAGQSGLSLSLRGLGDMPFSSVRRIG
jgi:flagellar basal-body rod modification protein FlgD